jgi:hypothetical protein
MSLSPDSVSAMKLTGSLERLDAGQMPQNGSRCIAAWNSFLLARDAAYFLDPRFNVSTDLPGKDKQSRLDVLLATAKADKATSSTSKASTSPDGSSASSSASPSPTSGLAASPVVEAAGSYAHEAYADVADVGVLTNQLFLCPIATQEQQKDTVEDSDQHKLRYTIWAHAEAILYHHRSVLDSGVMGDVASLFLRFQALVGSCDTAKILDAIAFITTMRKPASMSWVVFLEKIRLARNSLARTSDKAFHIEDKTQKLFLFRAMAADPRYDTHMAFYKKERGLTMETLLLRITTNAHDIESVDSSSSGSTPPLTGFVAGVAGPCYSYRDTGKCKFGATCRFQHIASSTDAPPRKDGRRPRGPRNKTPPAPEPKEEREERPKKGACYECGSATHGISACPTFKERQRLPVGYIGQVPLPSAPPQQPAMAHPPLGSVPMYGMPPGFVPPPAAAYAPPFAPHYVPQQYHPSPHHFNPPGLPYDGLQ